MEEIPFNKLSNALRRSDENDPSLARQRPADELTGVYGGISARSARSLRHAKSAHKQAAHTHGGCRIKGMG